MKRQIRTICAEILVCILFITSCGTVAPEQPGINTEEAETADDKVTFVQDETVSENTDSADETSETDESTQVIYPITTISREELTPDRFTVTSAGNASSDSEGTEIITNEGERPSKDFTLMVYMNGSTLEYDEANGIIGMATNDLVEMLNAGVDYERVNLIIYTGGTLCWGAGIPSNHNCILDLSKYSGESDLRKCVVANAQGVPNMGAPDTFASFLNFCCENYPAEGYGLICWNHGGGPLYGFGTDVWNDDDSLNLREMKMAMEQTEFASDKLDFVGFDACLMGSIENAVVWEKYADYLIASEDVEPGSGWDYTCLNELKSNNIQSFLQTLVTRSGEAMAQSGASVTLSVMDLSKTDKVVNSLDQMLEVLLKEMKAGNNVNIQRIRVQTKEFGKTSGRGANFDLVDVYDFAERVSGYCGDKSDSLKTDISDFILCQYANSQSAHGVTLYYPSSQLPYYGEDISDEYKPIAPSEEYSDYLDDYYSIWQTGTTANDETAGSEDVSNDSGSADHVVTTVNNTGHIQDTISFQLTQAQNNGYVSGYYNIFQKDFMDDNLLLPVVMNCAIEPDENGLIQIPYDPEVLCIVSDEDENGILCSMRQTLLEDDHSEYESISSWLTPGSDFEDISVDDLRVKIRVQINGSDKPEVIGIIPEGSDVVSNARMNIDLSRWDAIKVYSVSYEYKENSDGAFLPFSEWESTGGLSWQNLYLNDDFGFEMKPLSSLGDEFVCQVVIKEADGDIGTSEIVPFRSPEGDEFIYSTDEGTMGFRMRDDDIELTSYEGTDENIIIPEEINGRKVTAIGSRAFANNNTIKKVDIPDGVTVIESSAFSSCSNLEQVTLSAGLKEIRAYAFCYCKSLKVVDIPEGVEWIGKGCFSECGSLEEISIPGTVTRIGNAVLSECENLSTIKVSEGCTACKVENNLLLSADGTRVIAFPSSGTSFVKIPDGVSTISYGAFAGCSDLRMIQFPDTLETIENYAFYGCENLSELALPNSLRWIGTGAFGTHRFWNDPSGSSVSFVIGSQVDYIGKNAFAGYKFTGFSVLPGNGNYHSMDGYLTNAAEDYILQAPTGISGYITIPDGIVGLGPELFYYNSGITDIYIPDSVGHIGERLVYDKDNLTIHGQKGSYAEKYASENNITFAENR